MSLPLTFPNADLKRLLADADRQWPTGVLPLYGEVTGRGWWLVGDEGVYLMHNGLRVHEKPNVVYAVECDPTTLDFDSWWNMKRSTWGGDDGCEFIDEATLRPLIERGSDVVFEFDGNSMSILSIERNPLL